MDSHINLVLASTLALGVQPQVWLVVVEQARVEVQLVVEAQLVVETLEVVAQLLVRRGAVDFFALISN